MSDPVIPYPLSPEHVLERYRHALGEFIHDFTWLEVCLFGLLCAVAGTSTEIGQALFSGARADTLIKLINRCYTAQEREPEPYLVRALEQISLLNSVRNSVVHSTTFAIEQNEDEVLATNLFRYMPKDVKELTFSPETLYAMAKDARVIPAMLLVAECETRKPGSTGGLSAEMAGARPPWHYKSPPQASAGRKSRGTPRKHTRQRPPYDE